jgi:uncharacterized protein (DUF1501 family)
MDTVTRRKFLIRSGVVGAGVLAAGATAYTLQDILKTSGERPSGAKTLVVVTLYGGNDGLNTVIPHTDARVPLGTAGAVVPIGEVLALDATTGLNPA